MRHGLLLKHRLGQNFLVNDAIIEKILALAALEAGEQVLEVGPGGVVDGKDVVMTVKKGDKVITGEYSGTKVKVDGEELVIVRQNDILAVVE